MKITEDIVTLVDAALKEDLGDQGDITSILTIPTDKKITATMHTRENGVIAGLDLAEYIFHRFNPDLIVTKHIDDGDKVTAGNKIISISGKAIDILSAERTALNFLSHLSAIATETSKYVDAVSHTNAKILDTRKTLPAYRILHKYAVKMGGGTNHRMGLHDMILIKDNHIATAGSIDAALNAAKNTPHDVQIEIEVDTFDQLKEVLNNGNTDIVLLDNMNAEQLKEAVKLVGNQIKTEASGNVNLETVKGIAEAGVNYISIGALTHSVKALDIGLDISDA